MSSHSHNDDHDLDPDDGHDFACIPLPSISDEAVVQIQDFLYSVLDLFEDHYFFQIRRYYTDRSAHNLTAAAPPSAARPPPHASPNVDDTPF